ncbi:unnamed protein product [Macrosiphum euphorbiae]|uniref:Uncharacterized protein n=2 Tax=Macrosiphum euphorbiae TaxID=13131 RepID=A0AAV0W1X0_9HEMI|nr:unnamed protein product [Macrosiphum euphorbiae]
MYSVTIILFLCFCIFPKSLGGLVVLSHVPPDPRKKSNPESQHLRGMEYTAADSKFRSSSPSPICDCLHVSEHSYPYIVGSQVTGRCPPYHDDPQENGYRPPHISCPKETGNRPSPSTNCPTHECPPRRTMPPCSRTSPPCTTCRTTLPPCKKFRTLPPCTCKCQTLPPCTKCQTLPPCTECQPLSPCTTCRTLTSCTTIRPLKLKILRSFTTRRRRCKTKP